MSLKFATVPVSQCVQFACLFGQKLHGFTPVNHPWLRCVCSVNELSYYDALPLILSVTYSMLLLMQLQHV